MTTDKYLKYSLLIYVVSSSSDFVCTKTVNGPVSISGGQTVEVSGTYDLCDFVIGSDSYNGWYAAWDNRSVGNVENLDAVNNYTFYFNIAANVAKATPDAECDNYNAAWRQNHSLQIGYCSDIISAGLDNATCNEYVTISNRVAAYQAKKGSATNNEKCWRLHDGVTPPTWTFLDDSDPAKGISITYTNGDWCQTYGKNREFTMNFICSNDIQITPDYIETVYETVGIGCTYEFKMETYRGCPTECVVNNDKLCSGQGVCDYDWVLAAPKCFCYKGWYGEDCHDTVDPNQEVVYEDSDNSYVGALVVVILLLLVILFILGYLFLRYSQVKNQAFDFNFLQQTKTRRARKERVNSQDEYDEE